MRTIDDRRRCAPLLVPGARIVIVGAGWIGARCTAAARLGWPVTVIGPRTPRWPPRSRHRVGSLTVPWYAEAGVNCAPDQVASVEENGLALTDGGFWAPTRSWSGSGCGPVTAGWRRRVWT